MSAIAKTRQPTVAAPRAVVSSETIPGFFAKGINFYKLCWLFFITAFVGCMVEVGFMLLTWGELQNRSGVIYGPFSLVWGLGGVIFTLLFRRGAEKGNFSLFLMGTLSGAFYEYACSWVQEVFFGACFWDYSHLPLNINGRVNLVFSMFWGVAAVLWVRAIYPALCRVIGKIPNQMGKPLTVALAVFMAFNMTLSAAALGRMNQRQQGLPAQNVVEVFLDNRYPTARLQKIFTNLTYIGTDEARQAAGVPRPNDIPGKR